MNFREVNYQKKAVNELVTKTKFKIATGEVAKNFGTETDNELVFQAPVASGKTVMSGIFMEKLIEDYADKKIGFIWISTGKGELHIQSKQNMKPILKTIKQQDLQEVLNQGYMEKDTALYINWESLRNEDNIARREDSVVTIESVMENSELDYVIVLIDEAHDSRHTEKAEEVINLFNPTVVINITATPKNLDKYTEESKITIDIEEVIAEGFVKENVHINENLESLDRETILTTAIAKQKELAEAYTRYLDTPKVPLCLIQIENDKTQDDDGKSISNAEHIKLKLQQAGIANEKIGIWVGNEKECQNKEDIQNSEVEYLIFKQSIATGWDCPRSHILVRFREVKSVSFDIQTVGRILRTLEKKHYNNALIDNSYIYTEYTDLEVKSGIDNNLKTMVVVESNRVGIKPQFLNELTQFKIPNEKRKITLQERINTNEILTGLKQQLTGVLSTLAVHESRLREVIVKGELDSAKLLREDVKPELEHFEISKDLKKIKKEYMVSLKKIYPKYKIGHYINHILHELYKEQNREDENYIYKLYISNKEEIEQKVMDYIKEYERGKLIKTKETEIYTIPTTAMYKHTVTNIKNYLYTSTPNLGVQITKSASEKPFGELLKHNPNIKYWYKNGTTAEDFSIVYQVENAEGIPELKEYYPDFIIVTTDNKLYILDVKAPTGQQDFSNLKQKYYAGKQYELLNKDQIKAQGFTDVIVSMCKQQNGYFKYCINDVYSEETSSRYWEDLVF